jgi:predicted transcriptional regulator
MDLQKQIDSLEESDKRIETLLNTMAEDGNIPEADFKEICKALFKVQKDLKGGAATIKAVQKAVADAQQNLNRLA